MIITGRMLEIRESESSEIENICEEMIESRM